jgi:hypothetical protein
MRGDCRPLVELVAVFLSAPANASASARRRARACAFNDLTRENSSGKQLHQRQKGERKKRVMSMALHLVLFGSNPENRAPAMKSSAPSYAG